MSTDPSTPAGERAVIVTGSSRGFGCLIAARLAAEGWRVFATMRNPESRHDLAAAVAAARADQARVTTLPLDVLDPQSITAAVAAVLEETGGRLDAVVANAGIVALGAFEDTPAETVRRVMDTNYFGVIETVRATLPSLRASHGRVIVISSDSGLCGSPALSAYAASKHALEGWAESLAYEIGPLGVALSLIEPGVFRTGIWNAPTHRGGGSPYGTFADVAESGWRQLGEGARAPDAVVRTVVRALGAKKPKLRYRVGADARRTGALKRALPDALFAAYVRRTTGMHRWRPGR